ncbi:ABC transporter ATP-binding protein [Paenacidovorax monticola]|uniref:ATP-binding cassette domain-containing protein n=1 Tax=Paenacidovorax monticola TaxID=1926868 RepID=A0A7H0HFQ4_9BURK|nr:ATP-binding cassette domain-containing protein [Paenacidovorax monticola]QNP59370.1 ATP-binding cassette domain-containing protein [Paenacidovorax monticola]
MPPDTTLLQVHDLAFAHPGRPLWSGWSHEWSAGLGLVRGGDGSGKTTFLRLLAGQQRPERGRFVLGGADLAGQPEAYRRQVFWMDPRAPSLPAREGLTPGQWLQSLPAAYPGWSGAALRSHADGWELAPHQDKPFHALSTGTQRKFFMAAALASGAPLTLIDEPVAGLDKPSIRYLQQALDALAGAQDRLVLVAHYEALPGVAWRSTLDLPD